MNSKAVKFSIVAPVYNMEPWFANAIESVLSQKGDFEIEYILQDGASTDNTVEIFDSYRKKIELGEFPIYCNKITMRCFSEKDKGPFDAINKGFANSTGDIYSWADGDNTYEPGAFDAIAKTFLQYPEIKWIHGITNGMNEKWKKTSYGECRIFRQDWLALGIYSQEAYPTAQNGIFWRKELWEKVSPIPKGYRVSGDYWLWINMAKHARMWSLKFPIGNFMRREGQLHSSGPYKKEQWKARPRRSFTAWKARLFFSPQSRLAPHFQKFFRWLYPIFFMRREKIEYIDIVNENPVKRKTNSYLC
jgi:glycosyltransferase involved in cell wall biosynthesis